MEVSPEGTPQPAEGPGTLGINGRGLAAGSDQCGKKP